MRMIEGPTLIFSAQWAIGKATMLALGFWPGLFIPTRIGSADQRTQCIAFCSKIV